MWQIRGVTSGCCDVTSSALVELTSEHEDVSSTEVMPTVALGMATSHQVAPSNKQCVQTSKFPLSGILFGERVQSMWMTILSGKLLCGGCCWCWAHHEDAIPFW